MKLQLETYGRKYSVETQNDDLDIEECFELFKGLLVQATYNHKLIDTYIIELADELRLYPENS